MKKSKILSLIMALMFVFSAFSPGLSVLADEPATSPEPEKVLETLPEITQFEIKVNEETGEQVPSFAISVNEGTPYEEIGFPSALNAKIDNGEEWTKVPVIEWLQKSNSRFVPEGYLSYVPVFDGDAYSIKEGIAVPYGVVEFKAVISETDEASEEDGLMLEDDDAKLLNGNDDADIHGNELSEVDDSKDLSNDAIDNDNEKKVEDADTNDIVDNDNQDGKEDTVVEEVNEEDKEEEEEIVEEVVEKDSIDGFYFGTSNDASGIPSSVSSKFETLLFYLTIPEKLAVDNVDMPMSVSAFVNGSETPETIAIERWVIDESFTPEFPENYTVMMAVFADNYELAENVEAPHGVLMRAAVINVPTPSVVEKPASRLFKSVAKAASLQPGDKVETGTRNSTDYFQVNTGSQWTNLNTDYHYYTYGGQEYLLYCLQHMVRGVADSYTVIDIDNLNGHGNPAIGGLDAEVIKGLKIILQNGYPLTKISGVTPDDVSRQATQDVIRIWQRINDAGQQQDSHHTGTYNNAFSLGMRSYTRAQRLSELRGMTKAELKTRILRWVRAINSSNRDACGDYMANLLYLALNGSVYVPTLSVTNSVTLSWNASTSRYEGTVTITTNSSGTITYTAPSGFTVTKSGNTLNISCGINMAGTTNATGTVTLSDTRGEGRLLGFYPEKEHQTTMGLLPTPQELVAEYKVNVAALPVGDIEIVKKSSLGNQINGNSCYSLEGAEFSLVKKDDSSKKYTLITNASGYAKLTGIDSGTYILTETKAPKGHEISNGPKEVVIGGPIVHVDWVDEAKNDPNSIKIRKVDKDTNQPVPQGAASLAGAVYEIRYFADTEIEATWNTTGWASHWFIKTDADGFATMSAEYLDTSRNNSDFYTNQDGTTCLPLGTIIIKEVQAPTGYNIDTTVFGPYHITSENSLNTVISNHTVQSEEDVKDSTITIVKYTAVFGPNDEIAPAEAYANAQLEPGIEFSIKNSSGTTVATKTTGSDGKLTFGPLPYGTYTIVQNTNVEGYETIGSFNVEIDGDNHIKPVGVDDTIIVQDGNTTLKLYNKQKYGTLRVIKVDENGEVIKKAGVKFEIYDTDMHKLTIGGQSEFATNSEGIVDIAGLPYGQYYLVETATVAPFILDSTPQLITINSSTLDNAGMLKFEFENSQAKGRISIEKKGDVLTSVTIEEQNGVTVYKPVYTNTYLAGAQFQIIANEDIEINGKIKVHKDEVVETLTTNSTGPVTSGLLNLGSYRLHESVTPVGYITVDDINPIVLAQSDTNPITVHSESIQNTYQQTKFSLRKLAENIVVDPATGNVTITTDYKAGFVFALYVNEDVKYANGNIAISAGSVVAVATSDASGNVVFSGKLPIANYYVKEVSAPDDRYILDQTQYPVSNKNQGNTVQVIDIKVVNEPIVNELDKAWAQIVKVNAEDGNVVKMSGFKFDIFDSENNLVDQVETDTNGIAKLRMPLRHGWTYKVVETAVAPGFVLNTTPAYLTIDASSQIAEEDGTTKACYSINFENRPVKGRIEIHKYGKVLTSAEDKVQEGFDVSAPVFENKYLAGAEFEIISNNNIVINGITVVAEGDIVARLTTNSTGPVTTDDLYLGSYTIHESKTPEGYITAEDKEITIAERDGLSLIIEKAEITNVLQETEFSLVKHAEFIEVVDEAGNVEIVVRKSAGFVFGLYADQDFKSQEGDVVIAKDTRVAAVKSDDEGKVVFAGEYPIGDYYVKEIDYLTDRYLPNDATYPISNKEAGNSVPKIIKPIVNEPIVNELDKAWAQIVKVDAETGEILKIAGFKFDIFDKDGNKVDFVETDNNGVAQLRMPLRHGWTYKVKETAVPEGFVRNTEMFDLVIDDSTLETIDGYAERYTCRFSNTRVKGSISIEKTGLMITDKEIVTEGDFDVTHVVRTVEYLSGAKFRITAREDIVYNGEIKYHTGDEVAVLTTVDGRTKLEEMYLGKYKIEEIEAPAGYVLKPNITEVDLDYAGDDVAIIAKEYSFHNDLRNMTVEMLKHAELMGIVTDSDGNVDVTYSYVEGEGFTFGLFNAFDIVNVNTGDVIVPADTLIEICVSDENGLINFEGKYPVGNYYIKEIATLPKYVLRDDFRFDIDNSCSDPTVEQLDFSLDEPIINNYEYAMVKVTKTDITGGEGLPGATLEVHDEEGNIIYRHVTGEDGGLEEVKLIPGTYTLHEIFAPNGYALSEEIVTFVVNEDGTVEGEATMKDDVTRFSFYKIDEYGRTLSGAEFTMYDENGDVYAVAESDEDGVVTFENMLVGSYIIKETKALPDYQLSSETIELTVTDQWLNSNSYTDGGELMYSIMNYEIIVTGRGLSTGAIIAIVAGSIAIAGLAGLGIVFYKKKKESK